VLRRITLSQKSRERRGLGRHERPRTLWTSEWELAEVKIEKTEMERDRHAMTLN
jgi:hypothetical protein